MCAYVLREPPPPPKALPRRWACPCLAPSQYLTVLSRFLQKHRGGKREGRQLSLVEKMCVFMMDSTEWEPWFESLGVLWCDQGVTHRFPASSAQPLIRHLAFSLMLDYSPCVPRPPCQLVDLYWKGECGLRVYQEYILSPVTRLVQCSWHKTMYSIQLCTK